MPLTRSLFAAGAWLIAFLPAAPPDGAPPRAPCRDVSDCRLAGTRALDAGRMEAAQAAFESEVCFAWRGGETAEIVQAHNTLARLALRRGEPLQAHLWAGLALEFDSGSQPARDNLRLADEGVARLTPAEGVTGTYWHRWGDSVGDEVAIHELPGKRIRFELHAINKRTGPCLNRDYPVGGAYGHAPLDGRVAVWETREWRDTCRLRFSFGPDELTVEQDGADIDCGFGGGVRADGTYRRTSRQPPRFTSASPP